MAVMKRKARPRTGVAMIVAAYPRRAVARRAARELVRLGLLACATVAPGATTFYRWEGKFHHEPAVLLYGKTAASRASRAVKVIAALHPDRVPEILVLKTAGALPAYAAWVVAETKGKR
ncbi:MAG: divalent cation tolerance protein CutA [Candidatus Eisenbacteria bacterium]